MIPFRVLVRLKVFQLAGVAALAIPINTFLVEVCKCCGLPSASSQLTATAALLLPPFKPGNGSAGLSILMTIPLLSWPSLACN